MITSGDSRRIRRIASRARKEVCTPDNPSMFQVTMDSMGSLSMMGSMREEQWHRFSVVSGEVTAEVSVCHDAWSLNSNRKRHSTVHSRVVKQVSWSLSALLLLLELCSTLFRFLSGSLLAAALMATTPQKNTIVWRLILRPNWWSEFT